MLYIIQPVIMKALWDPEASRLLSPSRRSLIHERARVEGWRDEGTRREKVITQRKDVDARRESGLIKIPLKRQFRISSWEHRHEEKISYWKIRNKFCAYLSPPFFCCRFQIIEALGVTDAGP